MNPADRQRQLTASYLAITDPQERLMAICSHRGGVARLPADARAEDKLVPGCQSRVWIECSAAAGGGLALAVDSESAIVRGLATLVADVYQDASPAAASGFETTIVAALELDRMLSPTRLDGLRALVAAIRARARLLP